MTQAANSHPVAGRPAALLEEKLSRLEALQKLQQEQRQALLGEDLTALGCILDQQAALRQIIDCLDVQEGLGQQGDVVPGLQEQQCGEKSALLQERLQQVLRQLAQEEEELLALGRGWQERLVKDLGRTRQAHRGMSVYHPQRRRAGAFLDSKS